MLAKFSPKNKSIGETPINEKLKVTSSFRVAQLNKSESLIDFTIRAGQALYKSKNSG
jgi:GGDEF domain-containing protein